MTTAYQRFLQQLRDDGRPVEDTGTGRAYAQCPACGDSESLIITGIETQILLHCTAGCPPDRVMAAMGRGPADMFDLGDRGAFYSYPGGRIVHRTPKKNFPQTGNKDNDTSLYHGDRITDDTQIVYVPEGEKDVLALEWAGATAVTSAQGAKSAHKFDWSVLKGKDVIIVVDRDVEGRRYADAVVQQLNGSAASVKLVQARLGKDAADNIAAGLGLDDFDDFHPEESVASADSDYPEDDDAPQLDLPNDRYGKEFRCAAPSAPFDVARMLYRPFRTEGGRTLLAWRGGWMSWCTTHWSELDISRLRSHTYHTLRNAFYVVQTNNGPEARPWHPDKRKIANVVEGLEATAYLPPDIDPPAWLLHSADEPNAAQMISCENGILDMSNRQVIEHTPSLFNLVSVPFDYQEDIGPPDAWLEFLASIWGNDAESIALLQQYFGYVLSGRTDIQKMLVIVGPIRSGKGTIARVLGQLLGRGNVCGPTLASLATNFGLSPLLGKPLAIVSDARLGNMPAHIVVERLLSITGEDMLTVDRKYREPWSGKLPTRFVILTNELPRFRDSSGAIASRMLFLQMTNSFFGREDITLDNRLRAELPAILKWSLDGLDRLVTADSRFTEPTAAADAARLMADLASPMSAFVRDRCVRRPDASISRDDLYRAWANWALENGHHCGAKSTFGRDLRAVVPQLKDHRPWVSGEREHRYLGIAIKCCIHNGGYTWTTWTRNGFSTSEYVPDADSGPGHPGPNPGPGEQAAAAVQDGPGHPGPVDEVKLQVDMGGPGGPGVSPLRVQHSPADDGSSPRCARCNKPLWASASIARGHCEECRLDAASKAPADKSGRFAAAMEKVKQGNAAVRAARESGEAEG
jgi:putative DNA primase/helicase